MGPPLPKQQAGNNRNDDRRPLHMDMAVRRAGALPIAPGAQEATTGVGICIKYVSTLIDRPTLGGLSQAGVKTSEIPAIAALLPRMHG